MTDIALIVVQQGDLACDLDMLGADLATDASLQTAILISLFSDRLANVDDTLPTGDDRRGWWGDAYADVQGDLIGSRLWLLARAKQLPQTLTLANTYGNEALAWLVEDGVAASAVCQAFFPPPPYGPGWLALAVTITRPNSTAAPNRFSYVWQNL